MTAETPLPTIKTDPPKNQSPLLRKRGGENRERGKLLFYVKSSFPLSRTLFLFKKSAVFWGRRAGL